MLEQGPDFWRWFDTTQFSYIPLCSPNSEYVFNPNVTTFQSNCAEGLHFSAFILLALLLFLVEYRPITSLIFCSFYDFHSKSIIKLSLVSNNCVGVHVTVLQSPSVSFKFKSWQLHMYMYVYTCISMNSFTEMSE